MDNVHVGVQVRREPAQLIRADQSEISWEVDIEVVPKDDGFDFRGPAVQGQRGDRFLYLTWGQVGTDGAFEMFRRAKLMLDRVEAAADRVGDGEGSSGRARRPDRSRRRSPVCPVDPPAIAWSVPR